jgi:hypothetical protein
MIREKHDQYCKQFTAELLEHKGEVQVHYEISPDGARQADIYFRPDPTADLKTLGLLGQIAAKPCIIEHFYNQPTQIEIQKCLQKLLTLRSNLLNKAERDKKAKSEAEQKNFQALKEEELPRLWILATSASDNLLNFFGAKPKPNWSKGVYFCCADGFRTAIVAINRLLPTPDTLLLRLLGKGKTQQDAIAEFRALKPNNALQDQVEYLLYKWQICLESQEELTEDDKEVLMNLSEIVEERQQKIFQQGIKQGREIVENLLQLRFGAIDEPMSQIIERLLKLPPNESSRLILQSSREELLAKLGH